MASVTVLPSHVTSCAWTSSDFFLNLSNLSSIPQTIESITFESINISARNSAGQGASDTMNVVKGGPSAPYFVLAANKSQVFQFSFSCKFPSDHAFACMEGGSSALTLGVGIPPAIGARMQLMRVVLRVAEDRGALVGGYHLDFGACPVQAEASGTINGGRAF
jgi:hypothetical protein